MIDCHLHLWHNGRTPDQTLDHIRGLGCSAACILPLERLSPADPRFYGTGDVLELHARAPDLVIPFAHVDPRDENAARKLEYYRERGCVGYGEHKVDLPIDAPESVRMYKLCGELGMPVLIHFEEGRYNFNVLNFERLAEALPDVTFIGHGQSFWAYLEPQPENPAGYPTGPIDEPGPTFRWLTELPNVFGDLSAHSGLNALTRDPDFSRELVQRAAHKLLFATDCPCLDGHGAGWAEGCFGRRSLEALRQLAPSEDVLSDILDGNARRLFGLP